MIHERENSAGQIVEALDVAVPSGEKGTEGEPGRPSLLRSPQRAVVALHELHPADSPRLSGMDEAHVRRLVETDAVLPPLLVHRSTMRVVDGMHRLRAAILKGHDSVEVEFFDGSEDDAFIRAVEINTEHGLPLSLADRKAAASRIVVTHPALSNRAIARHAGLADKTVAAIRRSTADLPQSNTRRGQDGRVRPLDGREGRHRANEVIAMRPDASLREIAKAARISVSTAKDVRDRLHREGGTAWPHRNRAAGRPGAAPRAPGNPVNGGGRPARREEARDASLTLERLKRDPALRLTESGRELLRLLHLHVTTLKKWPDLVDTVPAHCTDLIAGLAQQCSQEWQAIGSELEQRRSLLDEASAEVSAQA